MTKAHRPAHASAPPERGPDPARSAPRLLSRRRPWARLGLLAALWSSPACISETPAGTTFASDPPGALLYIDGEESGYVTPCSIHLAEGDDHRVRFELPGHLPAEFDLKPTLRVNVIGWGDGTVETTGFSSPIYLPLFALIAPIRTNRALTPGRIFVRLQPEH